MEDIFETRSCIEILANDISQYNWSVYALQLTENYKVYVLGNLHPLGGKSLHPLRGKSELYMYDLFWDDYKVFVPSELTEYQDAYYLYRKRRIDIYSLLPVKLCQSRCHVEN